MSGKLKEWEAQAKANGHELKGWDARDSQRSKVYNAESVMHRLAQRLSEYEVEALVSKVEQSEYVRKNFGVVQHQVVFMKAGSTWSWARADGTVRFCPNVTDYVVLHELAHTYSVRDSGGHGWLFCAVLLDLVRHFMGQEAHDALKDSFKRNDVKFTVPRAKRQMSDEAKAAASARMAKAREARLGAVVEPHAFVIQGIDWDGNPNDYWYLVSSVDKWGTPNHTRRLASYCDSTPYLTRNTDKGIAKMFDKIKSGLYGRFAEVRAVPVSKLPLDRTQLPQGWKPE